jgi:hypothetical protein
VASPFAAPLCGAEQYALFNCSNHCCSLGGACRRGCGDGSGRDGHFRKNTENKVSSHLFVFPNLNLTFSPPDILITLLTSKEDQKTFQAAQEALKGTSLSFPCTSRSRNRLDRPHHPRERPARPGTMRAAFRGHSELYEANLFTPQMPFGRKAAKGDPTAPSGSRASVPDSVAESSGGSFLGFRRPSRLENRSSAASRGSELRAWRQPSTEHYLDRDTVSSLPGQVSPTVPAEYQNALWRPEADPRGGPVAHNNAGGGEESPVPRLPRSPRESSPQRLPFGQSGGRSDADEWETVASGPGSVTEASLAGRPVYRPRYQRAGSSLADNSSVGGLTLPERPRLESERFPPYSLSPAGSTSSRSYAHPRGQPADHPLARVPRLQAPHQSSRPSHGAVVGGSFITSQNTSTPRNPWAVSHESIPASSFGHAQSPQNSKTHLVTPNSTKPPSSTRGRSQAGEFWEDITEQLHQLSNKSTTPPRRTHNEWARNVQRAVARHTQQDENPETSEGQRSQTKRTYLHNRYRPRSVESIQRRKLEPLPSTPSAPTAPHYISTSAANNNHQSTPRPANTPRYMRWPGPMSTPSSLPLPTPPAAHTPSHTIHRGYSEFEIDDTPRSWSSPRGFLNIQSARVRGGGGGWDQRMRLNQRISYRVLVLWAIIATLAAVGLAVALVLVTTARNQ